MPKSKSKPKAEPAAPPEPKEKKPREKKPKLGDKTLPPLRFKGQPSAGNRVPVVALRMTPDCVALVDEMKAFFRVSRRELIDRAVREFYRVEYAERLAKGRGGQ